MIASLLKILAVVAKIFGYLFDKKTSPSGQYDQAKTDNANAVLRGDAAAVNARIERNIDRLSDDGPGAGNPG